MGIILGHLFGDYVFQSDWMASNKKLKGLRAAEGFAACFFHCFVWTNCIAIGQGGVSSLAYVLLFASHWLLDRTNIVKQILHKTGWMPNPSMWKVIIVDNSLHLLSVVIILHLTGR